MIPKQIVITNFLEKLRKFSFVFVRKIQFMKDVNAGLFRNPLSVNPGQKWSTGRWGVKFSFISEFNVIYEKFSVGKLRNLTVAQNNIPNSNMGKRDFIVFVFFILTVSKARAPLFH